MIKKADGKVSKTVVVNAFVATLGTAVGLMPELRSVIEPEWYPWILASLSLSNVFLRQITSTPMQ